MRKPEPRLGDAQRARPGPQPRGQDVAVEVPLAQSPSLGETGSGSCPPPGTIRRHLVSRVSSPGNYSEVPILNKAGTRSEVSELPVRGPHSQYFKICWSHQSLSQVLIFSVAAQKPPGTTCK